MFGKEKTKAKLIANLQQTYTELSKAHGISPGDFPDVRKMQEMLKDTDFSKFQSLRESYLKKVREASKRQNFDLITVGGCHAGQRNSRIDETYSKGGSTSRGKTEDWGTNKGGMELGDHMFYKT